MISRQLVSRLGRQSQRISARWQSTSPFAAYEMAPLDPIIGLNEEFQRDDFPQKVIVGVGAYRDDAGKPYVLPCVREAENRLIDQKLDMEYSGIVSSLIDWAFRKSFFSLQRTHARANYSVRPETKSSLTFRSNLDTVRTRVR